jgi:hypothetical protein
MNARLRRASGKASTWDEKPARNSPIPETKRRSYPLRYERQFFPMPSW